jgi:hypothetical protein
MQHAVGRVDTRLIYFNASENIYFALTKIETAEKQHCMLWLCD